MRESLRRIVWARRLLAVRAHECQRVRLRRVASRPILVIPHERTILVIPQERAKRASVGIYSPGVPSQPPRSEG